MGARIIWMDTAAGTAHSDSTTEASIARKAFAAGELLPGTVIDFECLARATSTNSTDTLTMTVRWGTSSTVTSNTAVATSGAVDAANDDIHIVRGRLHVQTTTRAIITVYLPDPDAEGVTSVEQYSEILTIAAGTAYYLDVTADWSAASASNSVQSEAWTGIAIT